MSGLCNNGTSTVVVAIGQTVRTEFNPKLAAPLKHRFDTVELPNLFCLAGTEWACGNGGGDDEVMCR